MSPHREPAPLSPLLRHAVRRALHPRGWQHAALVASAVAALQVPVVHGDETATGQAAPATSVGARAGDGSAGFVLNGVDDGDQSGRSVSAAGDVNGDGIGDVIIGALNAGSGGESYVVFGTDQGFSAQVELAELATGDGSAGFVINGVDAGDRSGVSVSAAGDVNGDGIGDVIIGASNADPGGRDRAGESYVVFGTDQGFPAQVDLADLASGDGSAGFVINGIDSRDYSGDSVSAAGDVNGDGIGDVIIGAPNAEPGGNYWAGESYVVFGTDQGFPAQFELADLASGDGSAGFVLNGIDTFDISGDSVSAAGDVNGDGIGDVIIGAFFAAPGGRFTAGESYVVFGTDQGFPAQFELADLASGDGSAGFVINGVDAGDYSGDSVSAAGDVNGDGIGDVIIGAFFADPGGRFDAGESYVVFGSDQGFPAQFELADLASGDGSAGFVLNGVDRNDDSGRSVSAAGDVNGDGIGDLIIGAREAGPGGRADAGESYVVFGTDQGFPAQFELADLATGDGSTGFVLNGIDRNDDSGGAVSAAGDVNGDGIGDLMIGALEADPGGRLNAGESYVVFGTDQGFPAQFELSTLLPPAPPGGTVVGINARFAGCVNLTQPQEVFTPLPDPLGVESWDCVAIGLSATSGDSVRLIVGGTGASAFFAGRIEGFEIEAVLCRNLTQAVDVNAPLSGEDRWECVAAGLPVAPGDVVRAIITGTVN